MSFRELNDWIIGPRDNSTTHYEEYSQPHEPMNQSQEGPTFEPLETDEADNAITSDDDSEYSFGSETDEEIMGDIMEYAMNDAEEITLANEHLAAEMLVMRDELLARPRDGQSDASSSGTDSSPDQMKYIFNKPGTGRDDDDNNDEPISLRKAEAEDEVPSSYPLILRWLLFVWKMKDL